MTHNPYHVPSIEEAKTRSGGAPQRSGTRGQSDLYTSKAVVEELRKDDAAMADELSALRMSAAPRTFHENTTGTINLGKGTGGKAGGSLTGDAAATVEFAQNMTTAEYVKSKRELGLVRMSLATKRAEIRKLEDEIDRAEKQLHQQQDQLENTREKFNSFLKHSNLEQDAAVRRANDEARAKQEKTVEIKKISARIGHAEMDTKKTLQMVSNCKEYKKFVNELTKPQWFYDVLVDLRTADRTDEILLAAERQYTAQMAVIEKQHEAEVRARAEAEANPKKDTKLRFGQQPAAAAQPETPPAELVPLEQRLDELHAAIEREAQAEVDRAAEAIVAEVHAMPIEAVHRALDAYPESRLPLSFDSVDRLLEVFVNVEEGNLFLIQNCQELEEELEAVAMDFLTERSEMKAMNEQRHSQMRALAEKIQAAQERLQQLDARHEALNSNGKKEEKQTSRATTGAAFDKSAVESVVAKTINNKSSGEPTAADLSPEEFKKRVEAKISTIFAMLTAGENTIKSLAAAVAAAVQSKEEAQGAAGGGDQQHSSGGGVSGTPPPRGRTVELGRSAKRGGTAAGGSTATMKKSQSGKASTAGGATRTRGAGQGGGGNTATTSSNNANSSGAPSGTGGDTGPNIGPVELLTMIENKLDEYHRFITDPSNGVDESLIVAVMKQSDKERRRAARQQHMGKQAAEQEERVKRALERSQAPVERRLGKSVFRRSHYTKENPNADASKRNKSMNPGEVDDNDGAEFFV